jgi:hypothetical protein
MTNLELAQAWANREMNSGTGSNLFFVGNSIYSYGTHYVAGVIIPEKWVAIINRTKYSVTTSKHTSLIVEATRSYQQIFAYYPSDPYKNTERVIRECSTLLGKYDRTNNARNKSKVISEIKALLLELKEFNEAAGHEPTDLQKKTIGRLTDFVFSDTEHNVYTPA